MSAVAAGTVRTRGRRRGRGAGRSLKRLLYVRASGVEVETAAGDGDGSAAVRTRRGVTVPGGDWGGFPFRRWLAQVNSLAPRRSRLRRCGTCATLRRPPPDSNARQRSSGAAGGIQTVHSVHALEIWSSHVTSI